MQEGHRQRYTPQAKMQHWKALQQNLPEEAAKEQEEKSRKMKRERPTPPLDVGQCYY